ncbi:hypothetical protein ACIQ6V_22145 [Streptomyces sp. NPDC096198]|uniref:hypothetical protein n=1 Tax=Streptomyces sp. NPDC096198 TaxID=3366080 RepID=UPI0038121435
MSGEKRRHVQSVLGMTGEGRPGGRWASVVDLVVMLATLIATVLVCRALGLDTWLALVIGGCAGAVTNRLGLGSRITRGRRG